MTENTRWGATPEEWRFASSIVGADLLPSFCNPDVSIPRTGKLQPAPAPLNKTPSCSTNDGSIRGFAKWTAHVATPDKVRAWALDPDHGILMICRTIRAIDIDIENPEKAEKIEQYFRTRLKVDFPVRERPNSGKRTLLLRVTPQQQLRKALIKIHPEREERTGVIEFLADKQQTLLFGTHPSGVRFTMRGDLSKTPEVSFEALFEAWEGLRTTYDPDNKHTLGALAGVTIINSVAGVAVDDPVASFLLSTGWVRSAQSDGKLNVRCPWAEEHSSDSAESSSVWIPAGVGGVLKGAFNCLHSHGRKYTTEKFLDKIGFTDREAEVAFAEVAEEHPIVGANATALASLRNQMLDAQTIEAHRLAQVMEASSVFMKNSKGMALSNQANINHIIRSESDLIECRFESFKAKTEVRMMGGQDWGEMSDTNITLLQEAIQRRYGMDKVSRTDIAAGIHAMAEGRSYDVSREWLNNQVWDGKPRIAAFGKDILKAEDSEYSKYVGLYIWNVMVGRMLHPGAKADMMPVLISPKQGTGKSSLVKALAPDADWFAEVNFEMEEDDRARAVKGTVVCEIPEMKGLATRNAEHIKAWLSKTSEDWRPLYSEYLRRYNRRCLLVGTSNTERLLSDPTGNRRFLPIHVAETARYLDWPKLKEEIGQYWAEARDNLIRKTGGDLSKIPDVIDELARYTDSIAEEYRIDSLLRPDNYDRVAEFLRDQNPFIALDTTAVTTGLGVTVKIPAKDVITCFQLCGWEQVPRSSRWRKKIPVI